MTGNVRPTPGSPASISTTTRSSSSTRAPSPTAGSSPSGHASTARKATTPTSARSCRPEASSCRTAPACCRRSSCSATSDEASSRRRSPNASAAPGSPIRVPTSKSNRRSRATSEWSRRSPTSGSVRRSIFFRNDFTDQISYRFGPVGDGIPEYINIDGSKASGIELELALQRPLAGFTATGTYSFVDTEVVTNQSTSQQFQPGQPLLRRPRHSGSFRAAYTRGRATVNFNLRMIGDRFDNSFLFAADGAERRAADGPHDRHHHQSGLRRRGAWPRRSRPRCADRVSERRQRRRHDLRLGARIPGTSSRRGDWGSVPCGLEMTDDQRIVKTFEICRRTCAGALRVARPTWDSSTSDASRRTLSTIKASMSRLPADN